MFDIFEFEKKYSDELKEIEEWNYLRNYYREAHLGNNTKNNYSKLQEFKNIFYGFKNWFRRYDYIFFSDSGSRKNINNKMYNIYTDKIMDIIGQYKCLLIETPVPVHYKNSHSTYIVSKRLTDLLTLVALKFKKNRKIQFLENINNKYNIQIDYFSIINKFYIQYRIYYYLFKIFRPKAIFLTCYYDKQYLIKAAHCLSIKVIEIQHGLISESHSAYFGFGSFNSIYLPDYILTYGNNDTKKLKSSNIFQNIICRTVGHYYLNYLKNNFQKNSKLQSILDQYNISIGISLQWTLEDKIINFIINLAKIIPEAIFILIPRNFSAKYSQITLPKNVILFNQLDCYQTIMHCDFHCTAYSTCAIEVPSLGTYNILINIDNTTNLYLANILNSKNTTIVNTEKEFISAIARDRCLTKQNIMESNNNIFDDNYQKNIELFVKEINV